MNAEKNQTLEQLRRAVALQRLQQRNGAVAKKTLSPAMQLADRKAPLPLSWGQQRLWFLTQLDQAAGAAYHLPVALRLSGSLDRQALQATLDRIVARHENLRTTFVSENAMPVQKIAPADCGFALIYRDLSAMAPTLREAVVAELGNSEARAPFDLATGPLIRGQLLRLAENEHVLLVTQHHIVSDGWSTGVLVKEVTALYSAFCSGQPDPLPPLAIQYADYAAWQRQWLQGETLQAQIEFWQQRLTGAPALLELPTDRPRPATQSYAGDRVNFTVPAELTGSLRALARRHGATLFMTMLAAWSALLSRLSGQDDILIGTSVANRRRTEVEPLIGFFLNSLALRVKLDTDPTVAELLAAVRTIMLDAYEHQDVPFEQIVEALQPERTLSYSPIFQTMLAFNNTPSGTLELPGLALEAISTTRHTAHFDLELALSDAGDSLRASFAYATDLFERATIERFSGYFLALLEGMVSDDTLTLSQLTLLSATQRDQVLNGFNATHVDYPLDRPLHELFEQQVRLQPASSALIHGDTEMSYAELNRRANQVAHWLITLGIKPDDRVAICMQRCPAMVIGMLGVLKAGGAYVPLDPTLPGDRLAFMLEDSAPIAVLTERAPTRRDALTTSVPTLALDDTALAMQAEHDPRIAELTSDHLAYVIYTSGSTGQPKGVMLHHRGLANYLQQAAEHYLRKDLHGGLVATPFGFDATLTTLLVPWVAGKPVVLLAEESHQCLAQLLDYARAAEPWLFKLTPAHLDALANLATESSPTRHVLVVGGEQLTRRTLARFRERVLPNATIINEYGPTEAVVGCTTHFSYSNDPRPHGDAVPIGRPIANMRIHLLDANLQPVPIGVTGELYIGGVQLARGYLNLPQLTAQRFVDDPFGAEGERLYRSGDLARRLEGGDIEYLGRNDFQVKIRGFRIELGEIEARLGACDGVREAVVVAREDAAGDKRLVAYMVPEVGANLSVNALRESLSRELAEYMIPSAFVTLNSMPLTPNGKLDRKALPSPDANAVASRPFEAPVSDTERIVAEVWQALLKLPRVSRHDHFFELGGHSLLAISLIERLRQRGLVADVGTVFTLPTLSALADRLAQAGPAPPAFKVPANLIPSTHGETVHQADAEEFNV